MFPFPRKCFLYNRGLVPYLEAHEWQRSLLGDRVKNPELEDVLILLEHPAVYTLGKGARNDFLKFDPQGKEYEVHRVERGGEVTYHCPGQLIGYPIMNLQYHQKDLNWYLRQLEKILIQTLEIYGLQGECLPGLTGVWLEGYKIAAIGIKVSRWITMHGFAINICADMTGFKHIVPCGIADKPVGCLEKWLPGITVKEVSPIVAHVFAQVFNLELVRQS